MSFAQAALGSSTISFNPYADNLRFLLGAYIIEDVIPTAWEVRPRSNHIRAGFSCSGDLSDALRFPLTVRFASTTPACGGVNHQTKNDQQPQLT